MLATYKQHGHNVEKRPSLHISLCSEERRTNLKHSVSCCSLAPNCTRKESIKRASHHPPRANIYRTLVLNHTACPSTRAHPSEKGLFSVNYRTMFGPFRSPYSWLYADSLDNLVQDVPKLSESRHIQRCPGFTPPEILAIFGAPSQRCP